MVNMWCSIIFFATLVFAFSCLGQTAVCQQQACAHSNDCPRGSTCFSDGGSPNGSCSPHDSFGCSSCPTTACKPLRCFSLNENPTPQCPNCCIRGLVYSLYNCSPQLTLQNVNRGVLLYFSDFSTQSGSNTTCSSASSFSSMEKVVSLASGWLRSHRTDLCLTQINITAPNNRSVLAKIVDECSSDHGCDSSSSYQEPCAPNAIGGTLAVWKELGYDIQARSVKDIKWYIVNSKSFTRVPTATKKSSRMSVENTIAGSLASGLTVLACLVLASIWFWRWKARERIRKRAEEQLVREMRLELLPQQFSYKDLQTATRNFSKSFKLGHGGFGTVFKGVLTDGSVVAVKRMDMEVEGSSHGHSQFKAEITSIGSIHHFNLVRLRGFCLHGPASMLVYEYMSNGSLDKWIFGLNHGEEFLVWEKRHSIALDVARGLAYLHEGACTEQVLHLDIKPQNILLDENMRARISDFGLCKLAERGKSQAMTVMRGTPGYMAPEWLYTKVTDKTDVYSFGMVMLELISSKRAVEMELGVPSSSSASTLLNAHALGQTASDMYQAGNILELVDPRLLRDSSLEVSEDAERFIKIGLQCIRVDPTERPSMQNVLNMLEGCTDVLATGSGEIC